MPFLYNLKHTREVPIRILGNNKLIFVMSKKKKFASIKNIIFHKRVKNIDIKFHYTYQLVKNEMPLKIILRKKKSNYRRS